MLVPLLSLYPLQSLLSFHTAALSLGCQRFLMLTVWGRQKASQSRPERAGTEHLYRCDATSQILSPIYVPLQKKDCELCSHQITLTCHIRVHVYSCGSTEIYACQYDYGACDSPHLELVGVQKKNERPLPSYMTPRSNGGQNKNDTLIHNRKFCWSDPC